MTASNAGVLAGQDGAVRAVLGQIYAAWAANDADAFVTSYADDATAVLPGSYLQGRAAIRATMADVFAGLLKGSRGVHEVQSVRFLDPGTAIVISKGAIVLAGEAEARTENKGVETWVLSRQDGAWRVRAFQNSPQEAP
jgi:uncharacterized protein (TIGR02246 family)